MQFSADYGRVTYRILPKTIAGYCKFLQSAAENRRLMPDRRLLQSTAEYRTLPHTTE